MCNLKGLPAGRGEAGAVFLSCMWGHRCGVGLVQGGKGKEESGWLGSGVAVGVVAVWSRGRVFCPGHSKLSLGLERGGGLAPRFLAADKLN